MFTKRVVGILTTLALLGSVAGYFGTDLRFFSWKSLEVTVAKNHESAASSAELQEVATILRQVASTSYNNALARKEDQLATAQDKLYRCTIQGENCTSIRKRIKDLEGQIRDIKRDKKRNSY